jgi:dTDP-4-dehydrorhamnose 3,5-epimerase
MIFTETELPGVFVVGPELFEDERGFFSQIWTEREFAAMGLDARLVECNLSYNHRRGTLRGMHFQAPPHAQSKLVRCTAGSIYDVAVDLRPASPTFRRWIGIELTASNRLMLFVPVGFAHGYQTLEDGTEVVYQVSDVYAPGCAGGVRWDDPAFGIRWPDVGERVINERDRTYPDFKF